MRYRSLFIYFFLLSGLCMLFARPEGNNRGVSADGNNDSIVRLLHADRLYYDDRIHATAQFLVGNVQFCHNGILMYCDSALFYKSTNSFDAYDNVHMVQGDTLSLDGDVLYYDGMEMLAKVRYNVVLRHKNTTLYTDSLDYDRIYGMGYFFDGGRLVDEKNELTSDWGEYTLATHEAVFNYNVRLVNPAPPQEPETVLTSDSLHYNTETSIAHIVGPSDIDHGDSHVYSESGYYDSKADVSYLLDRSVLDNKEKRLIGDSVVWDNNTKIGKAYGHILYTDTLNKNLFTGNYCLYRDLDGYMEAADSAVLMDYSQLDTLFAHADTFKVFTYNMDTDSMYRMMHGYRHFRAYRTDVQAVCDSVVVDGRDSCLTMYYDPIMWQENQQVLGEEIQAFFNDSTLDSARVLRQALSVERLDSVHYNQVSGQTMTSYFNSGEIYLITVRGNVLMNYYPFDDDSLMVGMNYAETTLLRVFMKSRKVDHVWMPAAQCVMYPIPMIPREKLYLEHFAWFDYIRPRDRYDIFEWRPKKSGSELKKTVTREPPKQKLKDVMGKRDVKDKKGKKEEIEIR